MSHGRYGNYWSEVMDPEAKPFVPQGHYTDRRDNRDPETIGEELLRRRKFTPRKITTHQIADVHKCEACGR